MRTSVLMIVLILGCGLWAEDAIKPLDVKLGLWETTSTSQTSGMPPVNIPEDALARMTPDQRAKMEQMMKGSGSPRTNTVKSCMTREKMNRAEMFGADRKNCTRAVVSSSGSKTEVRMECTDSGTTMKGIVRVERISSDSVKGSMQMTTTSGDRTMNMNSTFTSKYLGPDCGDIK